MYAKKVIERFGMQDAHPVSIPMEKNQILDADTNGKTTVFPYREAVGSLLYLANGTRPDICFAVNFVSRYMEKPTELHVRAVKRIIKYLKGTLNFGLFYFSNTVFDVQCRLRWLHRHQKIDHRLLYHNWWLNLELVLRETEVRLTLDD